MLLAKTCNNNMGIYVHWPFCQSKCPYCDFNSHKIQDIDEEMWLSAYIKELERFKDILEQNIITSIFFGGGTPSLAPVSIIEAIISYITKNYKIDSNIEITLEANPNSVEVAKFKAFKDAGVNRVSLGIQSLNSKDLQFLGRNHSELEARKALEVVGLIFANYSFDLIYGLPEQSEKIWINQLDEALQYATPHLSLYQLTIEKGTKFYKMYLDGEFVLPNDEQAETLWFVTYEIAKKAGLELYEISNYARRGFESKHNLNYWHYGQYLGIGPGAHSRLIRDNDLYAIQMVYNPNTWLDRALNRDKDIEQSHILSAGDIKKEKILMGLRTIYGIDKALLSDAKKLGLFLESKHLQERDGRIIATLKGMMVLNYIVSELC